MHAARYRPDGNAWLHEIKFDWLSRARGQLAMPGEGLHPYGLDWTDKFPGIAEAATRLAGTALIDGEAVAFRDGRPDFSTLKKCDRRWWRDRADGVRFAEQGR